MVENNMTGFYRLDESDTAGVYVAPRHQMDRAEIAFCYGDICRALLLGEDIYWDFGYAQVSTSIEIGKSPGISISGTSSGNANNTGSQSTAGTYASQIKSATSSYELRASYETSVPKLDWKADETCMNLLVIVAKELDS